MNPLKERRTATTTKAIKTLFISSVLLVGFIGMSLSLSQTASATTQGRPSETENPQCNPGERFVPSEGCIGEKCPDPGPGETVVEEGGQCFIIKTTKTPVDKVDTAPRKPGRGNL